MDVIKNQLQASPGRLGVCDICQTSPSLGGNSFGNLALT